MYCDNSGSVLGENGSAFLCVVAGRLGIFKLCVCFGKHVLGDDITGIFGVVLHNNRYWAVA